MFSLPEVPALAHAHPVHGLARESLAFTLGFIHNSEAVAVVAEAAL